LEWDVEMPIESDWMPGYSPEALEMHVNGDQPEEQFIYQPGNVLFDFDKDVIKASADRALQSAGRKGSVPGA
jgi:outer membrane protein OmpA-like peptidoglycan-associated protein